jgi:hypothetical protein
VQPFGEAAESDPSGPQLVDHGENVLGVTSEAVELPDGEHVAFAEMVEAGIEMAESRISDNRHCCSHVSIVFETGGRRIFWPSSQDTSR